MLSEKASQPSDISLVLNSNKVGIDVMVELCLRE